MRWYEFALQRLDVPIFGNRCSIASNNLGDRTIFSKIGFSDLLWCRVSCQINFQNDLVERSMGFLLQLHSQPVELAGQFHIQRRHFVALIFGNVPGDDIGAYLYQGFVNSGFQIPQVGHGSRMGIAFTNGRTLPTDSSLIVIISTNCQFWLAAYL